MSLGRGSDGSEPLQRLGASQDTEEQEWGDRAADRCPDRQESHVIVPEGDHPREQTARMLFAEFGNDCDRQDQSGEGANQAGGRVRQGGVVANPGFSRQEGAALNAGSALTPPKQNWGVYLAAQRTGRAGDPPRFCRALRRGRRSF